MPQPLSHVVPDERGIITSGGLIRHTEYLGYIMRVISLWAEIDGNLAVILSTFLKADIYVGTAMFEALSGGDARRSALLAAAKEAAPEWKVLLLQAALKVTKASRNRRNDFAHHIWMTCDALPDALLLSPPSVIVRFNASHRQTVNVNNASVIRPERMDRSRIMVYREPDFVQSSRDAEHANEISWHLYNLTYAAPEIGRRSLLSDPLIAQEAQKLSLQSDPLTQRILRPPVDGEGPPAGTHDPR